MTRRTLLASALAASATAAQQTTMGVATTSYMTGWRPKDTLEFLDVAANWARAAFRPRFRRWNPPTSSSFGTKPASTACTSS